MRSLKKNIECIHCGKVFSHEFPLAIAVAEPEDERWVEYLWQPDAFAFQCPACGDRADLDVPLTVVGPRFDVVYYYQPTASLDFDFFTRNFEADGYPTRQFIAEIIMKGLLDGCEILGHLEHAMNNRTIRIFVAFSLEELRNRIKFDSLLYQAHDNRRLFYQTAEPPLEFMQKGSRYYKKTKLKTVWALGSAFPHGSWFTPDEVDGIITREGGFFKHSQGDPSQLRRALIELDILERSQDGRRYWRIPEPEMTGGISFPGKILTFEKYGYAFQSDQTIDFCVIYRDGTRQRTAFAYLFEPSVTATSPLKQAYHEALQDLIQNKLSHGVLYSVHEELTCVIQAPHGGSIMDFPCLIAELRIETEADPLPSHLLVTKIGDLFFKLQMNAEKQGTDDAQIVRSFAEACLGILIHAAPPA